MPSGTNPSAESPSASRAPAIKPILPPPPCADCLGLTPACVRRCFRAASVTGAASRGHWARAVCRGRVSLMSAASIWRSRRRASPGATSRLSLPLSLLVCLASCCLCCVCVCARALLLVLCRSCIPFPPRHAHSRTGESVIPLGVEHQGLFASTWSMCRRYCRCVALPLLSVEQVAC